MPNYPLPQDDQQKQAAAGQPQQPQQPDGSGPQAQGVGTGFLNLQSVLAANKPGATGLANQLAGGVPMPEFQNKQDYDNATDDTRYAAQQNEPQKRQQAKDYTDKLNSMSGLQTLLQDQYKGSSYSPGQNTLDAFLAQQAGGPQFQAAQGAYQSAYDNLQKQITPGYGQQPDVLATPTNRVNPAGPTVHHKTYKPTNTEDPGPGKQINKRNPYPYYP